MENSVRCHGKVMEFYNQISVGTMFCCSILLALDAQNALMERLRDERRMEQRLAAQLLGKRNAALLQTSNLNRQAQIKHTCVNSYILSSWAMYQLFSGVNFVYRSNSLSIISHFFASFSQNQKLLQWRTVLSTLAICHVMS